MTSGACAVCGNHRILMKCSSCGQRTCHDCYVTRYALCDPCARSQGIPVRDGPQVFSW